MTSSACDVEDAFLRMSGETARGTSSILAPFVYFIGIVARKRGIPVL